jgi:hypothetical protein
MKRLIESGVVRMRAAIHSLYANVDLEVLSLPGGSLIAVILWLCGIGLGSIARAATLR